jgi:ferrous iron transport protein A
MLTRLRYRRKAAKQHHLHEAHCMALCCAGPGQVNDARFGIGRSAAENVLCDVPPGHHPLQRAGNSGNRTGVEVMSAISPLSTSLDLLNPGDQAVVVRVEGCGETAERLLEMGVVPGTPLKVIKHAPLGDPVEILLRGYHLSLRRAEAAAIIVQS